MWESTPCTHFDAITSSPEKLAEFIKKYYRQDVTSLYCHGQCGNDADCIHEIRCIVDWLKQPEEGDSDV